jgi:hypothetical protein
VSKVFCGSEKSFSTRLDAICPSDSAGFLPFATNAIGQTLYEKRIEGKVVVGEETSGEAIACITMTVIVPIEREGAENREALITLALQIRAS